MLDKTLPDKPHFSPSQLTMYTRCGEQYRRRYIEKHILPPGFALIRGTSVHVAAEHNFKQKISTHADLPVRDIVDRAASAFDDKVRADGVWMPEEEEARGRKVVQGEAKDVTVRLAKVLAMDASPRIQPVQVEVTQRIYLPSSTHDLLGRLDLVDEHGHIRDVKTGKKRTQEAADSDAQFTFYALTYRAIHKKDPPGIIIDQLVPGAKEDSYVPLTTYRSKADYEPLVRRIDAVLGGINAGIFAPATPGAWWCSPKQCGYWSTCKFINAERKVAATAAE